MKLTKVHKKRIAVSREKKVSGRTVMYKNPTENQREMPISVKEEVSKRVDEANKLYQVFFKADVPRTLRGHFEEISKLAARSLDVEEFCEKVYQYKGYKKTDKYKKTDSSWISISRFSYKPMGKDLSVVLKNFVKEYMTEEWQGKQGCEAAVKVLYCICDGRNFIEKWNQLQDTDSSLLEEFLSRSKACGGFPFVKYDTSSLENMFTLLLSGMVKKCEHKAYMDGDQEGIQKSVQKEIQWLISTKALIKRNRGEVNKIELSKIKNPYATEERLQIVLIRMRKSLKRGINRDIAICLLQGMAQMNGKTFSETVEILNRERGQELAGFIDAVNRDYYRVNIMKSVQNMDVKVQPDLQKNALLALSSIGNEKKEALTDILLRYAASGKDADQVLLEIKTLLFEYFLPGKQREKEKYTIVQNLWNIPYLYGVYLDDGFICENSDMQDEDMEAICDIDPQYKIPQSKLKRRIRYVNYGRYMQMMDTHTSDREKRYWIQYIKEFVEKNYVDVNKALSVESCYASVMMANCWKEIIRYLCGKYIDMGKAVFHFTNLTYQPEPKENIVYGKLQEQYVNGISSFDYEVIKAEETLQRDIANAFVSVSFAFSRAVVDEEKMNACQEKNKEDILFLKEDILDSVMRTDVGKQLLRFFGGESMVMSGEAFSGEELAKEFINHLSTIRNKNFHYLDGKKKEYQHKYASMLWKNDERAYQQIARQRYYANNAGLFYKIEQIRNLVRKLYSQKHITEAQIPAFRTVLKRKELSEYMRELKISLPENTNGKIRGSFEDTLYFLLKEIYYRDFIVGDEIARYFFKAVEENSMSSQSENRNAACAGRNFWEYVKPLKNEYDNNKISFGNVCQYIMTEYNQQNTSKQEKEIYTYFKMLIALCIRKGFGNFIKNNYQFLLKPEYSDLRGEPEYLDDISLNSGIAERNYEWFIFAHFLHPVQLNHLVGDFKSYIQYREDILRRIMFAEQKEYADQKNEVPLKVEGAKEILEVLEFVREVSGRISNEHTDYYESKEEYAEFLYQYIDFPKKEGKSSYESLKYFCRNILENNNIVDLYADNENPKVIRNIELARMYAGNNVKIPGYKKISADEIRRYYKEKDAIAEIMSEGKFKDEKELTKVVEFGWRKKRLTLNEVTDIFSIINDMLGKLVSFSYLRERDQMYLLLGFYYMAICAENKGISDAGWKDEILDKLSDEKKKIEIGGGLVLYQIISVYNYGSKLLYRNNQGDWKWAGGALPGKYGKFGQSHMESLIKIMRLFQNELYEHDIIYWRDYVDHMKYYVNQDQSIMELYSIFYSKIFGYSTKLRKSVVFNFKSILEKYHMNDGCISVEQNGKRAEVKLDGDIKSQKFTYKLTRKEKEKREKTVNMDALAEGFLKSVKMSLEYKRVN